jgi:hypothetical protein
VYQFPFPCASFRFRVPVSVSVSFAVSILTDNGRFAAVCSCSRALALLVYSLPASLSLLPLPLSPSPSLPLSLPSWILIGGTESCVRCLELTKDPDLSVVKHACIAGAFHDVLEELRARSLADCDPSLRAGPQILVENIARIQRDVFFVVQIPRYRMCSLFIKNVFSIQRAYRKMSSSSSTYQKAYMSMAKRRRVWNKKKIYRKASMSMAKRSRFLLVLWVP